jgi:hypothetical protein
MEQWVDERLAFAKKDPGVGMPRKKLDEMVEEQYGRVAAPTPSREQYDL